LARVGINVDTSVHIGNNGGEILREEVNFNLSAKKGIPIKGPGDVASEPRLPPGVRGRTSKENFTRWEVYVAAVRSHQAVGI
jgi:hypothetical protein